jgi:two-component system chemotaxis sensor kinase CheA
MSMDDSILQMFLEDTREHLADIESDLLDIEEAGEDFDPELVNKVFRTAHSIKGSAGFLALNNVRDLSHKIENVLDMVRSREMAPNSQVVNVVLKAFDKLEELINNIVQSEDIDISAHVDALTGLITATLPQEQKREVIDRQSIGLENGREIFSITEHELKQAQKGGNFIYLVEYDLIHDVHKKGKTPLDLMKFLQKSGLILDCKLDVSAAGDLDAPPTNRIPFFILYASILEPDLVKAIFQVEERYIHNIEPVKPAEAPAPTPTLNRLGKERLTSEDVDAAERELELALARSSAPAEPVAVTPPKPAEPSAPPPPEAQPATGMTVLERVHGFEILAAGKKGALILNGRLTIERSEAVKEALLRVLELFEDISLNLEDVEEADLSALQLLLSALKTAERLGVAMRAKIPPSGAIAGVASRAGFDSPALAKLGLQ